MTLQCSSVHLHVAICVGATLHAEPYFELMGERVRVLIHVAKVEMGTGRLSVLLLVLWRRITSGMN